MGKPKRKFRKGRHRFVILRSGTTIYECYGKTEYQKFTNEEELNRIILKIPFHRLDYFFDQRREAPKN